MSASGNVDTFMRAEEEASRLVEELTRLKAETESYRTARGTLEAAGTGIASLAEQLAGAAQRLDDVIRTLRTIGTPELLRAQEAAAAEVAALREELADARRAMDAGTEMSVGAVSSLRGVVLTIAGAELVGLAALAALILLRV